MEIIYLKWRKDTKHGKSSERKWEMTLTVGCFAASFACSFNWRSRSLDCYTDQKMHRRHERHPQIGMIHVGHWTYMQEYTNIQSAEKKNTEKKRGCYKFATAEKTKTMTVQDSVVTVGNICTQCESLRHSKIGNEGKDLRTAWRRHSFTVIFFLSRCTLAHFEI